MKTLMVIVACLIGLAGIWIAVMLSDFSLSDICGNEVFQEKSVSGGQFKAIIFQRDCGATTGFSTQVSLVPPDKELPNESGNIFIVSGYPKDIDIEVSWLTPTQLLMRHTASLFANKKESFYKGITISYE